MVAQFDGLLEITPETSLERTMTIRGRIEYQYKTYGGVNIIFIEVKLYLGNETVWKDWISLRKSLLKVMVRFSVFLNQELTDILQLVTL
jgi:hypothetical protein